MGLWKRLIPNYLSLPVIKTTSIRYFGLYEKYFGYLGNIRYNRAKFALKNHFPVPGLTLADVTLSMGYRVYAIFYIDTNLCNLSIKISSFLNELVYRCPKLMSRYGGVNSLICEYKNSKIPCPPYYRGPDMWGSTIYTDSLIAFSHCYTLMPNTCWNINDDACLL